VLTKGAHVESNILFIMTDQQRYDAMSAHGGAAQTPALDRLAAEGTDCATPPIPT